LTPYRCGAPRYGLCSMSVCISVFSLQGYLAYKKPPPTLGPPWGPRHGLTVGSQGKAFSYERDTLVLATREIFPCAVVQAGFPSCSHTHTHSLFISLFISLSLTHTHTHTYTQTHTFSHTHVSHTLTLSLGVGEKQTHFLKV
jgi:hypothetical protein